MTVEAPTWRIRQNERVVMFPIRPAVERSCAGRRYPTTVSRALRWAAGRTVVWFRPRRLRSYPDRMTSRFSPPESNGQQPNNRGGNAA